MARSFSYDVFLSHNSKDKPRVRKLAERLKKAGLKVWFDEWCIKPGEIIALKVDEGLEQSRVLLLCVSQNALESGWVSLERSTAIHRDPANEGRRFVPLLLEACDLPDTLRRYKYLDWRKDEGAEAEVVEALRTDLSEAAGTSQTPSVSPKESKRKGTDSALMPQSAQIESPFVHEREFTGHSRRTKKLVVSPDGTWAVSCSDDLTIKLWELNSGNCRAILRGHTDDINTVAISPDGKQILSGSDDFTARIWDAETGLEQFQLKPSNIFECMIRSVNFLPDGRLLLGTTGDPDCLQVWNPDTKKREKSFKVGLVMSASVTSDGRSAIVGGTFGKVSICDLHGNRRIRSFREHDGTVWSTIVTSDGQFVASCSSDRTIKIWNLGSGVCIGTFEGHQGPVRSISISSDGALLASAGGEDGTVRLWNLKLGACIQVLKRNPLSADRWSPMCVTFSPDGSRLVVGTMEGKIGIYRLTRITATQSAATPRRYVNAKVVLLGEGTVGKTSLAHRLIDDEYVIKGRTHGMKVWPLPLPLPPDETIEREALLWDLAGQEDYRLIHRLFLNETSLALLLINPQKEDPFAEAGDWLKGLKTAAANDGDANREAARLLILSQVDVGGPKVSNAKLDQFCKEHGFADWLITSASTGRNCSDKENGGKPSKLKELIAASIPWEKLPWTSTPRLLAELKKAVMTMRDKADIRLLRFSELTQRLEQALPEEKFAEADVRTAVTLLANHGLARTLKFGDLVLLQPSLLSTYAGSIIHAARAHTDEIGCVLEKDIYGEGFDFAGVERLKHADEQLLLRALVQTLLDHSLCIAEDSPHGRHLVFPSQYRRGKDSPKDPDILVSYTFSGEWQTIWTTLVVRLWYSQQFQHRELWRNAAEFASPKGYTLGLKIDNKQGEGTATVSLYFDKEVHDDLKAIFIEYFHRHLVKYGCEVKRDRRYVCPACGKAVKDLGAVRLRLEEKKDFIRCQPCDEKVPLIDFIEQRLKSDPIAKRIMAMEEETARALDTQALEQILIGHMMAISGEANQIFRPVSMFDHGIDGEVEFKDDDGKASGKRIYIQLKSGNSYLRTRKSDGTEVFDVKEERHLHYWVSQPVDVYLVIRQTDERTNDQTIRWMNVTRYLKERKDKDKRSKQIIFTGERLDFEAVYRVRDGFFPKSMERK